MKKGFKKILPFIVIGVLFLLFPQVTHACTLFNLLSWPGCIVLGITGIIDFVIKIFLIITGWFIEIALSINRDIPDSPAVQVGFKIALSIANLGFVLGIVVIAVATILRIQTYGIKKILWKLVVAALLVNFSLVIISPLLTFTDSLTQYFMEGISGGGGGIGDFVERFAAGFDPQKQSGAQAGGAVAEAAKGTLSIITSTLIAILMLVVITITMSAFFIMLMIRYVVLSFLLVLMPFVWVAWVFPALQSNWSKWWHTFLRWMIFPPLVIFFIYLGMNVWVAKDKYLGERIDTLSANQKSAGVGIEQLGFLQTFFADFAKNIGQQIVVIGLMLGGLFAANALSITGAKWAYGAAQSAGRGVLGVAGRGATRVTTRPIRGERGQKIVSGLQAPGATKVGRLLRTVTGARYIGRGLEAVGVAGGARQVDDAERRIRPMTNEQIANGMTTFTAAERMKGLEILMKRGSLDIMKDKGGVDRYLNEDQFKRYSQGKLFGDLNNAIGSDVLMRDAAKVVDKGGVNAEMVDKKGILGEVGKTVNALDLLTKASIEFAGTLSKSDVSKAQLNDMYSGKDFLGIGDQASKKVSEYFTLALATARPELVPSMMPKMKGPQLQYFSGLYRDALEVAPLKKDEKEGRKKAFEQSLLANTMGFIPETLTVGEAPSPPPSPPPGPTSKT